MEQKNSQTFKIELKNFKEVYDYCYLNQIIDMNSFVNKCFKQGFDIQKYGMLGGETPPQVKPEVVEKIVEVGKIVEVPVDRIVETIKEVEVIKYVDKEVIKEVPVEKIVSKIEYIYDKTEPQIIEKEVIKEVEKIVEVPVEKEVIKEIIKEVPSNDSDEKIKMLQNTLLNQKKELTLKTQKISELEEKIKQLENLTINQGAVYMRSSNLYKD
jgi:hypothetical protein